MLGALITVLVLHVTPLEASEQACERDYKACPERDRLRKETDAQRDAQVEAEEAAGQRQRDEQLASVEALEQKEIAALKRKCGRDYHRVAVGMSFDRVRLCSGGLTLRYADGGAKVYEGSGGLVRVEAGKITRVLYR